MRGVSPVIALALAVVVPGCALGAAPTSTTQATTTQATSAPDVATTPGTAAPSTTAGTTTTTTRPPLPAISIVVAGDTSFTHGLDQSDPLGEITPVLSEADLAIVNVETVIAEEGVGAPIEKVYVFKSPPASAGILADAGVDVAALANNHAIDYGPEGVLRTIEILEGAGLATAGTGPGPGAAYAGTRARVEGWRVAVLSFTRVPCDRPEPGETFIPEVAWACPGDVDATVATVDAAAARSDVVVVMAHWGIEREVCPDHHQRELARAWVDAGADLVVGSHPHVLQGVERLGDAWVLYSTGNFAFPSAREESSYTAAFRFEVAETDTTLSAVPVRIVDGRPVVAEESRPGILEDLTDRSFGVAFDDQGRAVETERPGSC